MGPNSSVAIEQEKGQDERDQCRMHPGFKKSWHGSWNCPSVNKWNFWQQGKKLQAAYFLQVFTFPNRFSHKRKLC